MGNARKWETGVWGKKRETGNRGERERGNTSFSNT
jgi:hypothetical protein